MEPVKRPHKRARQSSPAPGDPDAINAQKQLKKRIQNRNSQKCYREKQLSYIRSLENIVNTIKGDGGVGGGKGENELKLIQKNRELENALLRLRKKFLSLSTAAMGGAEDTIFQEILKNAASTPEQIADSPVQSEDMDDKKGSLSLDSDEKIASTAPDIVGDPLMEDPTLLPSSYLNNLIDDTDYIFSDMDVYQNMEVSSIFSSPAFPNHNLFQPRTTESRLPGPCISFDVLGVEETLRSVTNKSSSVTELENAASLAVRVMLKQSPFLEDYFNLMGGMKSIERIILWRLHPTASNRDAIPAPFTPTTLQQYFPEHHHCIDFLPWGELRDQLLLHIGEIDFGTLGLDCLLLIVQDIPHLSLALPSLQACFNIVEFLKGRTNMRLGKPLENVLGLDMESIGNEDIRTAKGHQRVYETLKKYHLDEVVQRKLNPKFAEKYKFLDLSRITTNYPIASFCGKPKNSLGANRAGFGPWLISAT